MKLFIMAGLFISTAAIIFLAGNRRTAGRENSVETGSWEDVWRERLKK